MTSASEKPAAHILPVGSYFKVYAALLVLTGLTVLVSEADLGRTSLLVALTIAIVKSSLVAAIFMHLWWDDKLNLLVFVGALIFLIFFLVFPFIDMGSRGALDPIEATRPAATSPAP